jgi:membrane protein
VFIHKLTGNQVNEQIPLIVMGGMFFNFNDFNHNFDTFKFGTSMTKQGPSYPLVLFSLQFGPLFLFFEFGLSNSLSTINFMVLLIMMFYIWINCMILLLGFELNATITKLKKQYIKLI